MVQSLTMSESDKQKSFQFPVSFTIVVPAYNVGAHIAQVLAAVCRQLPDADVLVVDDASSDDTSAQAEQAGARVVRHARKITFQLVEVAGPRTLFRQFLIAIRRLKPPPRPA